MASYIFQDLLSKAPMSIRNNVADARSWMQDNVTTVTTNKILSGDRQRMTDSPSPGRMYMFSYDPKTKDKLPYYDRFPLVFPFDSAPGGFMGLNLHYLSPMLRARFLDKLMEIFFTILVEFGLPVAASVVMGFFIFLVIKYILDSVVGQVSGMHGIIMGLENRVKNMNNDMIKLDIQISDALNLRQDEERISRADGKEDARRD